jgi:hypothetical protein
LAAGVTYLCWSNWQAGAARVGSGLLGVLSTALTVFLLYNIAAGGNPPRRPPSVDEPAAVEEVAGAGAA